MFVAVFEREFGNAGFVEVAEAFGDHAIILFLRCAPATQPPFRLGRATLTRV